MTLRAAWVLGVVVIVSVMAAVGWTIFKPTHLVEVDVDSITAGTPTASGIPTPIKGDLIQAAAGGFVPHFPFTDFREARDYASHAGFQFIVRGKLPEGTYLLTVKNSLGSVLMPLRKEGPDLFISPRVLILGRGASRTYFFGSYVLEQEAGTSDQLTMQVARVVPGFK